MLKLLIAEDEIREARFLSEFIVKHFSEQLVIAGVCSNGITAIQAGKESIPDIALLDIEMPRNNGLEVAKALHSINPAIHILILTAHGTFEYAKKAISIGVDDYLTKPYEEKELFNAVSKIVAKIINEQQKDIHILLKEITESPSILADHPIVRRAQSYIEQHYPEKISLESLADELGFSPGYVSKCLKKYNNKSFSSLLLEHRINESVKLLANENLTVSEIAYRVGFSDPNYFYKCFQKTMGIPPKKVLTSLRFKI